MNAYLMKEIVAEIMLIADELARKPERDLFQEGQLVAYAESLTIIHDTLAGYDLSEIGLDFDVDKKYLT